MALTNPKKTRLREYLFERFEQNLLAIIGELWLGFFESATQRTARAQGWIVFVRTRRANDKAGADTANTAYKATLDAEITELDTLNGGV